MHAEDICEIRFMLDECNALECNALASNLLLANDVDDFGTTSM